VFGCCGFLSFSLVFCRFGGRFEASLYIHFTRRWVISTRHSSASRKNEDEKKGGKVRHSSQLAVLWGVCGVCQQACPVDHLGLPHVLDKPPLAEGVCSFSDGGDGDPQRFCAGRGWGHDAFYDIYCAYLGELAPREVECESEQADALCLHKCAATASASLSMRSVRPVGVCAGLMQV
jgi:hypothetical protein